MPRPLLRTTLLAAISMPVLAQSTPPVPHPTPTAKRSPIPVVDVFFPGGAVVHVQGPAGTDDYAYGLAGLAAPSVGQVRALQWCWETLKFSDCQVQLVRPQGSPLFLKNSSVRQQVFTPDGKWLVGMGDNTLRLWNPTRPADAPRTLVLNMNGLERLEVSARNICVTGRDRLDAVYTVLTWPDLNVVKEQRVQLLRDARTTTRQGNTTTTTLKYERIGTFTPPPCS